MDSSGHCLMKVLHTQGVMNTHPRLDCLLLWSSPLHLRQRGLCLGQPERHLHGAVEVDSGGQRGAGLLLLAGRGIQLTFRTPFRTFEAILEWPPAETGGGAIYRLFDALQLIAVTSFSP